MPASTRKENGVFIEKIALYGFKSFVHRTEIPLSPGITAIVGPNGCGKSNISDAFRWVLGEQNARNLRGERIQDVIFKGAGRTKQMGMAEVVLTMRNEDGYLPIEYEHVAIARRIFRSGQSEFGINKVPCRLKDIRDLFSGTGLGSHGYAVIERRMVDEVLSDKDDARRFLFEEAAGIIRYKQRRREAERKLVGVEQDLTRIEDMIREIEREVRSLRRQAGKVRRWRRTKTELDRLEIREAVDRWRVLRDQSKSSEAIHKGRESKRDELQSLLAVVDATREAERQGLLGVADSVDEGQRELQEATRLLSASHEEIRVLTTRNEAWAREEEDLQARYQRYETRLAEVELERETLTPRIEEVAGRLKQATARAVEAAQVRDEAEQRLRSIRSEVQDSQQTTLDLRSNHSESRKDLSTQNERREEATERLQALEEHLGAFSQRESKVERDLTEVSRRFEQVTESISDHLSERGEVVDELEQLRERRETLTGKRSEEGRRKAALESRLSVLEEQHARHAGFDAAVQWVLEHSDDLPGFIGVVGEEVRLRADREAEGRAVLGERVAWVIVQDEDSAIDVIGQLRELGLGGVTFFPLTEAGVEKEAAEPEIVELFDASDRSRPFVNYLGKNVRLAGSIMEARLADRDGIRRHATAEGLVIDGDGAFHLTGGKTPESEILSREQELPALREELDQVSSDLAALDEEDGNLDARETELKDSIARREVELSSLEREKSKTGEERSSLRTELAMLREERTRLYEERNGLQTEIGTLEETILQFEGLVNRSQIDSTQAQEAFAGLRERSEKEEEVRDLRVRESTEREVEAMRLENEHRELLTAEEGLGREAEEKRESIEEIGQRIAGRTEEADQSASRIFEIQDGLEPLKVARRDAETRLNEVREQQSVGQSRMSELDNELKTQRAALDDLVNTLHEEDVERVQSQAEAEQIRSRIQEEYSVDLKTWVPPGPEEEGADIEALSSEERREKISEYRKKMETMGNLNFLAEEEYETHKERLDFHSKQAEDLTNARTDLLEAIRQINETAGGMFQETFDKVQQIFGQVFAQLFPGGEASLRLEGDDPLEGDVEISARPREKRLESIRLLSTGERSLTAIALLFSLYLIKPSPICLLDEVDAPLDDANLDRFLEMIQTLSDRTQFIMITHNKKTMQVAKNIFGVTMEEAGISKIVSVRLEGGEVDFDALPPAPVALDTEPLDLDLDLIR